MVESTEQDGAMDREQQAFDFGNGDDAVAAAPVSRDGGDDELQKVLASCRELLEALDPDGSGFVFDKGQDAGGRRGGPPFAIAVPGEMSRSPKKDERITAEDAECIKDSLRRLISIIRYLEKGEFRTSPLYTSIVSDVPYPWSDTPVALLNPAKVHWNCGPVRDSMMYHEYRRREQYEDFRRERPDATVGDFIERNVAAEIRAHISSLLLLMSKLKGLDK